ncbi:branched-chain amino acid ABC transporter permease [Xanthobacter sp. KR7-65]|uniref:branched-chain amino acid ABC transporter permease n=1 Tax=Xanthobacter sp. KR7-65 TaxID=3156612 RepID=UPI0032B5691C
MFLTLLQIGIVSGLLSGLVYALMSTGFNLSLGIARVVNLQHGAAILWSMYAAYFAWHTWGLNPLYVTPVICGLAFVIGYVAQRLLIDRILNVPEDSQILFSIGLLISLQYFAQFIFSTDAHSLQARELQGAIILGDLFLQYKQIAAAGVALVGLLGLHLLLRYTDLGRDLKACSQNAIGAAACGLDNRRLYAVAMGISWVCAALAGIALSNLVPIVPDLAFQYAIMAVVVSVLGGLGSVVGSLIGGLLVGVVLGVAQALGYGQVAQALVYTCVFVTFLFKPTGIFGAKLA